MSSKHVLSEESQLAILKSDAPPHDKAVACHKLVYVAGPKSVAPLAAMLGDEVMSDYARSGLEAIEDPSASQALIDALPKLKGRLLAGAVNSLGVRREGKAVEPLQKLATEPSSEVRSEAIASLGMIATPEVVPTLKSGLEAGPELRTASGHASLIAVGNLRADGEAEAAADLLKTIMTAFPDGPIHDAAKRL
jgi:HEAT repeat protein